ncbi:hypothetical protein C6Q21_03435 [Burkholderia multivorans]|nr:hypothetical protein C6Q21_03435 [Burkholderia multivorans]
MVFTVTQACTRYVEILPITVGQLQGQRCRFVGARVEYSEGFRRASVVVIPARFSDVLVHRPNMLLQVAVSRLEFKRFLAIAYADDAGEFGQFEVDGVTCSKTACILDRERITRVSKYFQAGRRVACGTHLDGPPRLSCVLLFLKLVPKIEHLQSHPRNAGDETRDPRHDCRTRV